MKKQWIIKLSALFLFVLTSSVFADEKGFYVGGSLGYSDLDQSESDFNSGLAAIGITATSDIDDSDLGWKLFGGYNINQYFGLEIGYVDLGEADYAITITAPAAGTGTANAEVDGFNFAGIARYPLSDRFDVFGKVGAFVWDIEGSVTLTGVTASADEDGTSVMFGMGGEYEFTKKIGVRAEWEYFNDVDSSDLNLFSVGIEYDF